MALTTGVRETQARRSHAGFFSKVTRGRPMVTLKLATTLDGRIATATGESKWITGPEARRAGYALRARHDAVLIGAETARADDPTLTVRDLGIAHQPVRVVVSRDLNVPFPSKLTATAHVAPLWIMHGAQALKDRREMFEAAGAKLFACQSNTEGLDPASVVRGLADAGLTRVYCEGGGSLGAALMRAGLVDDIVLFTAGAAIGAEGRAGLGNLSLSALADAPRCTLLEQRRVGKDLMSHWSRQP